MDTLADPFNLAEGGQLHPGNFGSSDAYAKLTGDFNGDGLTDLGWFYSGPSGLRAYTALNQKVFPDMMSSFENQFDGRIDIEYNPSSEYINTRLPFIVHPVSRIEVDDGFGNSSTTEYSYSGGLYDFPTREFRGFETVTQKTAVGTASEIWTETKFHRDEYYKAGKSRWI